MIKWKIWLNGEIGQMEKMVNQKNLLNGKFG